MALHVITITIAGKQGEGKTCIANICREALQGVGMRAAGFGGGRIPWFSADAAMDMLSKRVEIRIVEEDDNES